MMNNRENEQDQFWATTTISIEAGQLQSWGINPGVLPLALALTAGGNEEKENSPEVISFIRFEQLLKILSVSQLPQEDLDQAIRQAYQAMREKVSDSAIMQLQLALLKFFPPDNPGPIHAPVADGFWGPRSESVLKRLLDQLNLKKIEDRRGMAERLSVIAQRRLLVSVSNGQISRLLSASPYFDLTDPEKARLRIGATQQKFSITRADRRTPFLDMDRFGNKQDPFEALIQWYALLNLRDTGTPGLNVHIGGNDEKDPTLADRTGHYFPADADQYLLEATQPFTMSLSFIYESLGNAVPLFIWFSDDGSFRLISPPELSRHTDRFQFRVDPLPLLIDQKDKRPFAFIDGVEGNYLKVFLLSGGLSERIARNKDTKLLFHALFTASATEIIGIYTLGIISPLPTSVFRNEWVLVAGSATRQLRTQEEMISRALGAILAAQGWGLVIGVAPGVDYTTARAYAEFLQDKGIDPQDRIKHLVQNGQHLDYTFGSVDQVSGDWLEECSKPISAVIAVGGKSGTIETIRSAMEHDLTVLPIADAGGAAAEWFSELSRGPSRYFSQQVAGILATPLNDAADATKLADDLVTALSKLPDVKPLRFKRRWILIAGTGNLPLPENERWLAAIFGRRLAAKGYGLISGGWPGVDEVAATAFHRYLKRYDIPTLGRLVHLLEPDQKELYRFGEVERSEKDWNQDAVNRAAALIMIGGLGGTYDLYRAAKERDLPIIPIRASGGDAERAFEDLTARHPNMARQLSRLNSVVEDLPQTVALVSETMSLLSYLTDSPVKKVLETPFRETAIMEHEHRPVTDKNDLQQNRWGGLSERDGIIMTAEVKTGRTKGSFEVTVRLRSVSGKTIRGEVAFFLDRTYDEQVRIVRLVKGIAELNFLASKAFTVGALTENGVALELDLDSVPDAPEGFYDGIVSEAFSRSIKKLYGATPVRIKKDLQKFRWGGLFEVGGKRLEASVEQDKDPADFAVTVQITAASQGQKLQGEAAFFMHSTYRKEIRFARFEDGVAEIRFKAYEAFTIGARTSDGVELELDLQRQIGYPKRFYYEDERIERTGFYKAQGIEVLFKWLMPDQDTNTKVISPLLLFKSETERIWLAAWQSELLIVHDDRTANDSKDMIISRFPKSAAFPLMLGVRGDAGTLTFGGSQFTTRYTLTRFKDQNDLQQRIEKLSGPAALSTPDPITATKPSPAVITPSATQPNKTSSGSDIEDPKKKKKK
jgi:hypothetical protein